MNTPTPWYKQFWPWFLIFVPVITVIVSMNLMYVAINTEDSLVVDDYYKQGKAINIQLEKIQKARELGIQGKLSVEPHRIVVQLESDQPLDGSALRLDFHHATLSKQDFQVNLLRNATGQYVAEYEHVIDGKWHLTLTSFDQKWKIQQVVTFPHQDEIALIP
ncbi:FixH family protein [Neptunicella sp. SCSIO 80796]|uniref:FixH family protein n=1 Tax=Neptunicella plasticusilytica TaxID=3117012 RepID=UPI003A4E3919